MQIYALLQAIAEHTQALGAGTCVSGGVGGWGVTQQLVSGIKVSILAVKKLTQCLTNPNATRE